MEKISTYQSLAIDSLLISLLENEGIIINTPTALAIQKVLANTDLKDFSFAKLKYKIAPILCRSKEEQEKIYQILDKFDKEIPVLPPEKSIPPVSPLLPELTFYRKVREFIKASKIAISLLLLAILVAVAWFFIRKNPPKPTNPILSIQFDTPIINKPVHFEALLSDTAFNLKNYEVDWSIENVSIKNKLQVEHIFSAAKIYQVVAYLKDKKGNPIDTSKNDVEVLCEAMPQVSILYKQPKELNKELYLPAFTNPSKDSVKYTYRWFLANKLVSSEKTLLLDKRKFNTLREIRLTVKGNGVHCSLDSMTTQLSELPTTRSRIVGEGKPLEIITTINWQNVLLTLFLGVAPFLIYFLTKYFLQKKKPNSTPESDIIYGHDEPYAIEFKDQEFLINDETEVNNFVDKLRKRQLSEAVKLNLRKSITTALKAVGLPELYFNHITKPTEFVIFIDKEQNDSHLTHLFDYLIKKLQKEQIILTVYDYYKEPLYLSNDKLNMVRVPIEKIATFHAEATLLIIGESKNFVYPIKKVLKDWVSTKFKAFDTKILITPFAINDWDMKERLLSEAGIIIIPADMNAQNSLDKVIFHQADKQQDLMIPPSYPARFQNLQTIEGLKNYLDDTNLLDWVCSLAVYPYTDWNLTLAIGNALEKQLKSEGKQTDLVNYTNLLKLGRISWLHDSTWNEGLRVEMLQQLDNATEALARQTLLDQLIAIKGEIKDNSLIKREFDVHEQLNSFLLEVYQKDRNVSVTKEPVIKDMFDKFHIDQANEIYLNKGESTLLKNPNNDKKSVALNDYFEESNKLENEKLKAKHSNIFLMVGAALFIFYSAFSFYSWKNKINLLDWQNTAPSTITFKVKSFSKNSEYLYSGFMKIDTTQKEFSGQKDTTIVLKNLLINDTTTYGKYKLEFGRIMNSDLNALDSFKLNRSLYSLSLENSTLLHIKIYYPVHNEETANMVESFLTNAYDVQKQEITIVMSKDFKVFYFDKKYETEANTCAAIINKNLTMKIQPELVDSTKSVFRGVPIGIILPYKIVENTWTHAILPTSLTEIWHGTVNNRLVTINLEKKVLYYSTADKNSWGTYSIDEVLQKNGIYKVITQSKQGYKLFFVKNVTQTSYSLSVCQQFFKTKEEIYPLNELFCDDYNKITLSQQYSRDPNVVYLPVNPTKVDYSKIFTEVSFTNNPFLPEMNKNKLGILFVSKKFSNAKKNDTSPNNPFDRNYLKFTYATTENTKQATANDIPTTSINQASNQKKLLWVDDHEENNADLIEKFRKKGINVILAKSNNEALNLLGLTTTNQNIRQDNLPNQSAIRPKSNNFDLIISGVTRKYEGQNAAFTLFREIRKSDKTIPLVEYSNPPQIESNTREAISILKVRLITNDAIELEDIVNNILFPIKLRLIDK